MTAHGLKIEKDGFWRPSFSIFRQISGLDLLHEGEENQPDDE